jgi:hypothetical protein
MPGAYIMDKVEDEPLMEIIAPKDTQLHKNYEPNAIICRFKGYWPLSL